MYIDDDIELMRYRTCYICMTSEAHIYYEHGQDDDDYDDAYGSEVDGNTYIGRLMLLTKSAVMTDISMPAMMVVLKTMMTIARGWVRWRCVRR